MYKFYFPVFNTSDTLLLNIPFLIHTIYCIYLFLSPLFQLSPMWFRSFLSRIVYILGSLTLAFGRDMSFTNYPNPNPRITIVLSICIVNSLSVANSFTLNSLTFVSLTSHSVRSTYSLASWLPFRCKNNIKIILLQSCKRSLTLTRL